jgi:hypothetical protein
MGVEMRVALGVVGAMGVLDAMAAGLAGEGFSIYVPRS